MLLFYDFFNDGLKYEFLNILFFISILLSIFILISKNPVFRWDYKLSNSGNTYCIKIGNRGSKLGYS